MKTLRLLAFLAALGIGVAIGWTSLFVASFFSSKSDMGIGCVGFDQDGAA